MAVPAQRLVPLLALAAMGGCGDPDGAIVPSPGVVATPQSCLVGERLLSDGRCVPPGVQDNGCAAGTVLRDGAAGCRPAGLPPALCQGGGADYDVCVPILPSDDCAEGMIALLGETECRQVADCGDGTWGTIPVDQSTEFVDSAYPGSDSDGSEQRPWITISEALAAAAPGAIVALAAGSYAGGITIMNKPVRLWGRCPSLVEVHGGADDLAGIMVREAHSTEIRGLAVRAVQNGLVVLGSRGVLAEQIWVHHTGGPGVLAFGIPGRADLLLREALVERATAGAVMATGATVIVEASQLRDTQPHSDGTGAAAVAFYDIEEHSSTELVLRRSLMERSSGFGVLVQSAAVTIEDSVVRDTAPTASGLLGQGLRTENDPGDAPRAVAHVRSSVVERNHSAGLATHGGDLWVQATAIRDIWTTPAQPEGGFGLLAEVATEPASMAVHGSVVERGSMGGVLVNGGVGEIHGVALRDNPGDAASPVAGSGIWLQLNTTSGQPTSGTVTASLVQRCHVVGMFLGGATATVEGTLIEDTSFNPSSLAWGRGVQVQSFDDVQATLTMRDGWIRSSYGFGALFTNGHASVERVIISETVANADQGFFGDGLAVMSRPLPSTIGVIDSEILNNERAGASAFGALLTLQGTISRCNAFDLAVEPTDLAEGLATDAGGNACGCGETLGACAAVSAGLRPPVPLPSE